MERINLNESDWDRILEYIDNGEDKDGGFFFWLEEDKVRATLYEELLLIKRSASLTLFADSKYKAKVWESVLQKIEEDEREKRIQTRQSYIRVAAVVLPLIFLSVGYFVGKRISDSSSVNYFGQVDVLTDSIEPGSNKATLILADGTPVDLTRDVSVKETDGTLIFNSRNQELLYKPLKSASSAKTNKLIVPRGGQYLLRLADGTKVWLNSGSSLVYPTSFCNDQRIVKLEGEAYFEVTKNQHQPFLVKVKGGCLRVLGTSFNVDAYDLSKGISATLVEGKITMEMNSGARYTVKPMENAVYSLKSESISVEKHVDPSLYVGWKDGFFRFKNQRIGDITDRLSRWYACDIVYKDESIRNLRFTGVAERSRSIEYLLDLMSEIAEIKYEVKNGIVFIAKREAL